MKELINNLIEKSGLNSMEFAKELGISPAQLSNYKKTRHVNVEKISNWAKLLKIDSIEYYSKGVYVQIKVSF